MRGKWGSERGERAVLRADGRDEAGRGVVRADGAVRREESSCEGRAVR